MGSPSISPLCQEMGAREAHNGLEVCAVEARKERGKTPATYEIRRHIEEERCIRITRKKHLLFKVLFCITSATKRKGAQFGQPGHTTVWTCQVAVEAAAKCRAQDNRMQITTASQGKQRHIPRCSILSPFPVNFFILFLWEAGSDPAQGVQFWEEGVDGFIGIHFCAESAWDLINAENCVMECEGEVFCLHVCAQE